MTTILPWTWRPACIVTASRICSIGKTAAIGTVILPARIASVIRSRAAAARRYIRNHMDLGDLEEMARFPPVRGQAPPG